MKRFFIMLFLMLTAVAAGAQKVTDQGYRTVAHIRQDGTIEDSSYKTIGHAKGIPMKWAAFYFFFRK